MGNGIRLDDVVQLVRWTRTGERWDYQLLEVDQFLEHHAHGYEVIVEGARAVFPTPEWELCIA